MHRPVSPAPVDNTRAEQRAWGTVLHMKSDRWWVLEEPADVLAHVLRHSRVTEGDVVVARVDVDSQKVTGTRTLDVPKEPATARSGHRGVERRARHQSRLSDIVRSAAEQLAPFRQWTDNGRGGMSAVFITVVCRQGHVVDTQQEWQWLNAWRYSNHFRDGFDGDVYVVTPHGWTGVMDQRCGLEPALQASTGSSLRLVDRG